MIPLELLPLNVLTDLGDTLLTPFYWVVSGLLVAYHQLFSPIFGFNSGWSWTLAILLLTCTFRLIILPLYKKQIDSSRAMQTMQPQLNALREKYGSDRQRMGEETMKLYEEAGVSPYSSCLPILAQMPIFLGLFWVLNGAARGNPKGRWLVDRPDLVDSLQNATIFGARLSDRFWPISNGFGSTQVLALILILAMTGILFMQQLHMMRRNMPPSAMEGPFARQQQMMLYLFPLMYAFGGVSVPIGVLIYWLTSNIWTMLQQWWIIRTYPTPGTPAHIEWEERMIAAGKDPKAIEAARAAKLRAKKKGAAPATPAAEPTVVARQDVGPVHHAGPVQPVVRRTATGEQVVHRQQPRTNSRAKRRKH